MSTSEIQKEEKEQNKLVKFIKLYVHEVVEALVAIVVIRLAMEKDINWPKTIKASMLIGLLTYMIEQYSPDFKQNIRQGISFTVGSQLMAGIA